MFKYLARSFPETLWYLICNMVQSDHDYTYIPSVHFSDSVLPTCFHFNYFHLKWYTFAKKISSIFGVGGLWDKWLSDSWKIEFHLAHVHLFALELIFFFWGPIFGKFIKLHISQFCCSFLFNDTIWIQARRQESWNGASLWNVVSEFLIIVDYEFCTKSQHTVPWYTSAILAEPPCNRLIFLYQLSNKKLSLGIMATWSYLL